jgi:hypothetical protein
MWDFARKNWKTNIAFQGGRTTRHRWEKSDGGEVSIGRLHDLRLQAELSTVPP